MGARWSTLPVHIQQMVEKRFLELLPTMSDANFVNFVRGSYRLGYRWEEKPEIREPVLQAIIQRYSNPSKEYDLDAQKWLSNLIFYLGELKFDWNTLPIELRNCLVHAMQQCSSLFTTRSACKLFQG
jgi:hypothetical protein